MSGYTSTLLSGLRGEPSDAYLFRLYDIDAGVSLPSNVHLWHVIYGNTWLTFSDIPKGDLEIKPGEVKHLALQVDTTDENKWPSYSTMQWAISQLGGDESIITSANVSPIVFVQ